MKRRAHSISYTTASAPSENSDQLTVTIQSRSRSKLTTFYFNMGGTISPVVLLFITSNFNSAKLVAKRKKREKRIKRESEFRETEKCPSPNRKPANYILQRTLIRFCICYPSYFGIPSGLRWVVQSGRGFSGCVNCSCL